jgi:hypothetical protein
MHYRIVNVVALENGEIFFQFELGNMSPILIPFNLLILDEFLEDVVSQGFLHQLALFCQLNRFG